MILRIFAVAGKLGYIKSASTHKINLQKRIEKYESDLRAALAEKSCTSFVNWIRWGQYPRAALEINMG